MFRNRRINMLRMRVIVGMVVMIVPHSIRWVSVSHMRSVVRIWHISCSIMMRHIGSHVWIQVFTYFLGGEFLAFFIL